MKRAGPFRSGPANRPIACPKAVGLPTTSDATITLNVTPMQAGTIRNLATVSADPFEPAPGNKQAADETTVTAAAVVAAIPTVAEWADTYGVATGITSLCG